MHDLSSRSDLAKLAAGLEPLSTRAAALGINWMLFGAQDSNELAMIDDLQGAPFQVFS